MKFLKKLKAHNQVQDDIDDKINKTLEKYALLFSSELKQSTYYKVIPKSYKTGKKQDEHVFSVSYYLELFIKNNKDNKYKKKHPLMKIDTTFFVFKENDNYYFKCVPTNGFSVFGSQKQVDLSDDLLNEFNKPDNKQPDYVL